MNEIDLLIAGLTGGAIAGVVTCVALQSHIYMVIQEKIKSLEIQLLSLRIELNKEYDENYHK